MDMAQQGEMKPEMGGGDMKAKMAQCMSLMEEIMGMIEQDPELVERQRAMSERQGIAKEVFGQ